MQKTKLIHLFRALETDELREFAKFSKSPFHNKNERVIALYQYLRKYQDDLSSPKLNKETAFKKLFPKGEKYADWKMRELMSDLSLLIEQYFVWKEATQKDTQQMLLIKSLRKRQKAEKYFFKNAQDLHKALNAKPLKGTDYYYDQLQLNLMLYYHPQISKYSGKDDAKEYLTGIMENLDFHYATAKLRHGCETAIWEHFKDVSIPSPIPTNLLDELSAVQNVDHTLLNIYSMIGRIFKEKTYHLYENIKLLALAHFQHLDGEESGSLLTLLINAASVTNQGRKEMLYWYRYGLAQDIFLENGSISPDHFNNIVSVASSLKEYEWTKNFIKEYYVHLPQIEDRTENIAQLYNAQLAFAQKDFSDTVSRLYRLEFEDFSYGIRHYTLMIRSLYELQSEDIFDKCNAFNVYIFRKNKNNIISRHILEFNRNFISIVEQLARSRGMFKIDADKIKNKIDSMDTLNMREWLLEKVSELKKPHRV